MKRVIDLYGRPNQLVYLQEVTDKEVAQKRLDEIISMTKAAKINLIESSHQTSNDLINSL